MFAATRAEKRAAFLPYFPIGYPSYERSLESIAAMARAGVDGFELGIPFSDPIADGPTIQAATQVALENGTTVARCLEAVRSLRAQGIMQPMLMMGYANPLLAFGVQRFLHEAHEAGADGIIVPDLPPEEAHAFASVCHELGLAMVFMLAPTSNEARIALAAEAASGFLYVVSVTGITGARSALPPDLSTFIARLRARTDKPLVLGFGISSPEHARQVNQLTDGFIVGSALVRAGGQGLAAVQRLTLDMLAALK